MRLQTQCVQPADDNITALAVLDSLRQQIEAKGWQDETLKVLVLQAVALHAQGEKDDAVQQRRCDRVV